MRAQAHSVILSEQTQPKPSVQVVPQNIRSATDAVVAINIVKNIPQTKVQYTKISNPILKELGIEIIVPTYTKTGQETRQKVGAGTGILITRD